MSPHDWQLLWLAVGAVVLLVGLIVWARFNPFLALLIAAVLVGLGGGVPFQNVIKSFSDGLGATLGGIAAVISLGAMLGRLLAASGGADVLAARFHRWFGPKRTTLCLVTLALTVGLTTWFAVGLVLLVPILIVLTKESGRPFLALAIPLLSCLSVMHGLMPPHPGPVAAVEALGVSMGKVLFWGFVIGLPTAMIAGPIFARWAVRHVPEAKAPSLTGSAEKPPRAPGFGLTLLTMLLPVALMLLATLSELTLDKTDILRVLATGVGHPTVALALSVLLALWSFGTHCGFSKSTVLQFTEQSVASIGMTLLVVGGGGGFARVLRDASVAEALGRLASLAHLPPLLYGWLIAAGIRVATGSATVAITTAAGLMVPLLPQFPQLHPELLVVSIGCGSLFLSHLNDGGFWIVKETLGLTVGQTLRTWTITETLIGIAGLGITLVVDLVWR